MTFLVVLVVSVGRVRSTLRAVEPFDVAKPAADLTLLDLLLGHFLLLPSLKLHIRVVLDTTVDSAANNGAGGSAVDAAAGTAVLKAVETDSSVSSKGNTAVTNVPLLRAKGTDKLFVVRNQDNTALEVANSNGKTTKGVTIQEVGRLVKHEKMGVVPHGSSNDDLDLLTSGKRANLVVVGDLGVESEILKMLGDDLGLKLTVTETLSRSLVIVEFLDELVESKLGKSLTRDHGVVLRQETTPLTIRSQYCALL
jgi:hypothetical protein